jgi:hypothetical protein
MVSFDLLCGRNEQKTATPKKSDFTVWFRFRVLAALLATAIEAISVYRPVCYVRPPSRSSLFTRILQNYIKFCPLELISLVAFSNGFGYRKQSDS